MPEHTAKAPLQGVWVAMPTPWTIDGKVDQGLVVELMRRYADAGLDGAYTTGTDGEMHVIEFDDLRTLVEAFAKGARETGLPVQVGCAWLHTDGVIERGRMASEFGIDRIQVAMPA